MVGAASINLQHSTCPTQAGSANNFEELRITPAGPMDLLLLHFVIIL